LADVKLPFERLFWPLATALLCLMFYCQLEGALTESQTYDEAAHLAAGYSYLRTGDFRLNPEHPPLGKLLAALPLVWLNPSLDLKSTRWTDAEGFGMGTEFLYRNHLPADLILFCGRLPVLGLSALLGLALALWTRRWFGPGAALLALFLYATDSNFLAHGRYVTTDVLAALAAFLAVAAWARCLRCPTWWNTALAGGALGLALAAKFSLILLPVVFVLLALVHRLRDRSARLWVAGVQFCAVNLAALVLVAASYGPATLAWQSYPLLKEHVDRQQLAGEIAYQASLRLGLRAHPWLAGVYEVARHSSTGQPAYLFGRQSETGWWYYFPAALALKTPTAILALWAVALFVWLVRRRQAALPFPALAMLVYAAVYLGLSMSSSLNIGYRHLLPLLAPLLAVAAGLASLLPARRALLLGAAGLVTLQAGELARVHPHHLAFFNSLAGGPPAGRHYLVDSNLDWGQDMLNLSRYMVQQDIPKVCMQYFGRVEPGYYGIWWDHLPNSEEVTQKGTPDCFCVASATILMDVYMQPGQFRWLRERTPDAVIGYSLFLYDLRLKDAEGRPLNPP
jgi:hypothetical protein